VFIVHPGTNTIYIIVGYWHGLWVRLYLWTVEQSIL